MNRQTPSRDVPELVPAGPLTLPQWSQRRLDNGLSIVAIRRSAVPLVEIRLRVPFARAHLASGLLMANTLFAGTETMSIIDIATELQAVGGGLAAGADPDWLSVSGNSLVDGLDRLLELLTDSLVGAVYPTGEVRAERERVADRISVANTQPGHLARVALLKRMYGDHPYAIQTPDPEGVRALDTADMVALHSERVHPDGGTLVIVGDLDPEKALDSAAGALSRWAPGAPAMELPPVPGIVGGPITLIDRPGSVQSSLRLALSAVPRTHPDHAALTLANLVYGGYFSSRLVENIREDKGYTYSPHSGVEHSVAGSSLVIGADVANEVTAPALMEIMYELGRISVLPPQDGEIEQARQYALGSLRLGMATQSGIAGLVSMLSGFGLGIEWLAGHSERLTNVTSEQVAAAAAKYLAPSGAAAVVLGEATEVAGPLGALSGVVRG